MASLLSLEDSDISLPMKIKNKKSFFIFEINKIISDV